MVRADAAAASLLMERRRARSLEEVRQRTRRRHDACPRPTHSLALEHVGGDSAVTPAPAVGGPCIEVGALPEKPFDDRSLTLASN